MDKVISLKPRLSEKAYAQSEDANTFVFVVPSSVNRFQIAQAVAKQYGVTVVSVRVATQSGKSKRAYRRGGRVVINGNTSAVRKAYVQLKEGDKLPFFAEPEQDKKTKKEKK